MICSWSSYCTSTLWTIHCPGVIHIASRLVWRCSRLLFGWVVGLPECNKQLSNTECDNWIPETYWPQDLSVSCPVLKCKKFWMRETVYRTMEVSWLQRRSYIRQHLGNNEVFQPNLPFVPGSADVHAGACQRDDMLESILIEQSANRQSDYRHFEQVFWCNVYQKHIQRTHTCCHIWWKIRKALMPFMCSADPFTNVVKYL